ncbi:MAG: zinc-dependent peptidase [Planctomycetota bacterium]
MLLRLMPLVVFLTMLLGTSKAEDPAWKYKSVKVEGWTLHISEQLIESDKAATDKAVQLLILQLQEVVKVVPKDVVGQLRSVPLWFSSEYAGIPPGAEYHPSEDWLKENKRNPKMAKSVEFSNIRIFEQETRRMPNFALHELAHAYHDRFLRDGYENSDVKAAFENAKNEQSYENVEQRHGDGRSSNGEAYAMTNPMEYFAECSESFFSTNDFYPFNREELREHDPIMYQMLQTLWKCPLE